MSDWLPIESAPRDGTKVLIFGEHDRQIFAAWWEPKFESKLEESGDFSYRGAWTDNAVVSFGYEETAQYYPTLWMPMPPAPPREPPATEGAERREG